VFCVFVTCLVLCLMDACGLITNKMTMTDNEKAPDLGIMHCVSKSIPLDV